MSDTGPFTPLPGDVETPGGRRYRKEVARVGDFEHPDGPLSFDAERLRRWVQAFAEARDSGVRVPVPLAHSAEPTANAGWVEELELTGGSLHAVLLITRPDIAELIDNGTIRFTSLALGPLADDAGRFWEEAVLEISLVNEPHLRRQGPFITLSGDREAVRALATARRENEKLRRELAARETAGLEAEIDELISRGALAPADRDGVVELAVGLDDGRRRLLLESYARRGVATGVTARLATPRRDSGVAELARRFGLEPAALEYYLENSTNRPQP